MQRDATVARFTWRPDARTSLLPHISIYNTLHTTEGTAGIHAIPLRLLETGKDGTRRVLEAFKGGQERGEVRQEPRPGAVPARRAHRCGKQGPGPPRHTDTQTPNTHRHSLDVLPDSGAVVADDEQLQGVIDEAVLRGRMSTVRLRAAGEPLPPPRTSHPALPIAPGNGPHRNVTRLPPKQRSGARLPAPQAD